MLPAPTGAEDHVQAHLGRPDSRPDLLPAAVQRQGGAADALRSAGPERHRLPRPGQPRGLVRAVGRGRVHRRDPPELDVPHGAGHQHPLLHPRRRPWGSEGERRSLLERAPPGAPRSPGGKIHAHDAPLDRKVGGEDRLARKERDLKDHRALRRRQALHLGLHLPGEPEPHGAGDASEAGEGSGTQRLASTGALEPAELEGGVGPAVLAHPIHLPAPGLDREEARGEPERELHRVRPRQRPGEQHRVHPGPQHEPASALHLPERHRRLPVEHHLRRMPPLPRPRGAAPPPARLLEARCGAAACPDPLPGAPVRPTRRPGRSAGLRAACRGAVRGARRWAAPRRAPSLPARGGQSIAAAATAVARRGGKRAPPERRRSSHASAPRSPTRRSPSITFSAGERSQRWTSWPCCTGPLQRIGTWRHVQRGMPGPVWTTAFRSISTTAALRGEETPPTTP